jgi:hypothetical protein
MQQLLPGRIPAEIAERDLAVKELLKQARTSRKHLSRLRRAKPTLHQSDRRHDACLPGIHRDSPELTSADWD